MSLMWRLHQDTNFNSSLKKSRKNNFGFMQVLELKHALGDDKEH